MKKNFDLDKMKEVRRGPIADPKTTKVQISIRLDAAVLQYFMKLATEQSVPYQTLINAELKKISEGKPPIDMNTVWAKVKEIEAKFLGESEDEDEDEESSSRTGKKFRIPKAAVAAARMIAKSKHSASPAHHGTMKSAGVKRRERASASTKSLKKG